MVIKCDNCGGRVKFDIEKQLLRCDSCDMLIERVQFEKAEYSFDRYHCASCGAELNVNEGEMTSVCPYCGDQSIVYEGKAENCKVDYIVPFKVTYNNAVNIIRNEFESYKYSSKKLREFEVENVRPLYVPYEIYDVHIETSQVIKGLVYNKVDVHTTKIRHVRAIDIDYDAIEVDMSTKLPKHLATGLAPWYLNEKTDFNPVYIAGLYAGVADADEDKAADEAVKKATDFINDKVMESCNDTEHNIIEKAEYSHEITGKKVILLPVWFFASSYKGEKFSAIVNGQTGKVVSAVPYFKSVFWGISLLAAAAAALPIAAVLMMCWWLLLISPLGGICLMLAVFGAYSRFLAKANKNHSEYVKKLESLNKSEMVEFAKERK